MNVIRDEFSLDRLPNRKGAILSFLAFVPTIVYRIIDGSSLPVLFLSFIGFGVMTFVFLKGWKYGLGEKRYFRNTVTRLTKEEYELQKNQNVNEVRE